AAMSLARVRDAEGRYLDIPRHARVMCAVAAAAAGVDALDTVYTDIADLAGLRRECEDAVAMGFTGKISIHPNQIAVINDVFTPAPESDASCERWRSRLSLRSSASPSASSPARSPSLAPARSACGSPHVVSAAPTFTSSRATCRSCDRRSSPATRSWARSRAA